MTVGPSESRVSLMSPQCPAVSDQESVTSPSSCPHLSEFRANNGGAKPFHALQDCLRIKQPGGHASIRRETAEVPQCRECGESFGRRLYACVNCAAVSCHSHAAAHGESTLSGHEIFVDVDRAELFCSVCKDQIYDRDFDSAVVMAQTLTTTAPARDSLISESKRKRRKVDYRQSSPALQEQNQIENLENDGGGELNFPVGLRGLNNLGSTCFMNSILQALLHTAPLRNYFLSDKHNRDLCRKQRFASVQGGGKRAVVGGDGGQDHRKICLACDLDALFSSVFSGGDRKPYSPATLLHSWWKHAGNLASYEQQDAHEFFISILENVHEMIKKDQQKLHNTGNGDCCIAHKVFSGILRSDVMCMSCGFTSTTYDPCVDISLDLEPNKALSPNPSSKRISGCPPKTEADFKTSRGISTLVGCLDRYTRAEKLGPDQKFYCQQCQEKQESLKQMSIRKLPLVSCFHVKRFEHSPVRRMSSKVDRYLQFPFSLDMKPYLSSSILRRRFGNRMFPFEEKEENNNVAYEVSSEFELFAVVTHTGKLESGHYVTYLRLSNEWYKCDDAWITRVNENIVRASEGYMIFYVQKMLSYKTSEKIVSETVGLSPN